jgi:hypothetical protein
MSKEIIANMHGEFEFRNIDDGVEFNIKIPKAKDS